MSSLDGLDDVDLFSASGLIRVAGVLDSDLTTGVGSGNVHLQAERLFVVWVDVW